MATREIDVLWVLLCTFLVFMMQGGFLFVEAGLARAKNYINIAVKNTTDLGAAVIAYWLFGYGIMFGFSDGDSWGMSFWAHDWSTAALPDIAFFMFQATFAGTVVTIVSGAVAERMKYSAYLSVIGVMLILYPLIGRWTWGGGWLTERGFVDFAGSSVVHATGGAAALATVIVLGPRLGVFGADGNHRATAPSSMPMALFGGLVLWMGWFGFNGGSTLAFGEAVGPVLITTLIGGCAGVLVALISSAISHGYITAISSLNGALGGLVAITAGAHALSTPSAVIVGGIGGAVALFVERLLARLRIDDVVGAIPVHLGAGVWGTVAVGLFGRVDALGTGLSRTGQVIEQLIGVGTIAGLTFFIVFAAVKLYDAVFHIRVSTEDELLGLNEAEHHVSNELSDVIAEVQAAMLSDITSQTQELASVMQTSLGTSAEEAAEFLSESEAVVEAFDNMLEQITTTLDAVRSANGLSTRAAEVAQIDGDELKQQVQGLAERSSEIEKVVNIISGLANDSTMLALNARIEAERAGEAGLGFGVVAREVNALAGNTLAALDEIREIVATTRRESDEVTDAAGEVLYNLSQLASLTSETVADATSLTEAQGTQTEKLSQSFQRMASRAQTMRNLLEGGSTKANEISAIGQADREQVSTS